MPVTHARPTPPCAAKQPGTTTMIAGRSTAFRRWFGASRVVDPAGKPLVLYHGTFADVAAFDARLSEDGAFHFGTAAAASERLREKHGRRFAKKLMGQNVMPVYLRIANPKRLDKDPVDPKSWRAAIAQAKLEGHDGIVYTNIIEAPAATELPDDLFEQPSRTYRGGVMLVSKSLGVLADCGDSQSNYQKALQRIRVGAVLVPAESWVAFEPAQIKSALGNCGVFDPRNPDICDGQRALQPARAVRYACEELAL